MPTVVQGPEDQQVQPHKETNGGLQHGRLHIHGVHDDGRHQRHLARPQVDLAIAHQRQLGDRHQLGLCGRLGLVWVLQLLRLGGSGLDLRLLLLGDLLHDAVQICLSQRQVHVIHPHVLEHRLHVPLVAQLRHFVARHLCDRHLHLWQQHHNVLFRPIGRRIKLYRLGLRLKSQRVAVYLALEASEVDVQPEHTLDCRFHEGDTAYPNQDHQHAGNHDGAAGDTERGGDEDRHAASILCSFSLG
mmetsp:Transcript_26265/g.66004  ORF Transcript_26265/g.66004 Transcript_26265/m.66004 type:complete len:244 (-) Transcript_26265:307-1038(-)